MQNTPSQKSDQQKNRHPTGGPIAPGDKVDNESMEPKGLPNSDRYHTETVHAAETDDQTKIADKHTQK
jgi:hypothetical protein